MTQDVTLADEIRSARKEYRCDQCVKAISPSAKYRRVRGVCEGYPFVWRAHEYCDIVAREIHHDGNLLWDETVVLTDDVQPEDHEWIRAEYPAVAARLGFGE